MDEIDHSQTGLSQPVEDVEGDILVDEVAADDLAVDEVLGNEFAGDETTGVGDFGRRDSPRSRFHASGYQFDLKTILYLFTFFSLLFLPMTLVAPQDRAAVATILAISFCLAIYAFALISWVPDSALVIFLVSAPAILLAIGALLSTFAVRWGR